MMFGTVRCSYTWTSTSSRRKRKRKEWANGKGVHDTTAAEGISALDLLAGTQEDLSPYAITTSALSNTDFTTHRPACCGH